MKLNNAQQSVSYTAKGLRLGFLTTLIIYGGIMNPASVIMWQNKINLQMIISSYVVGFPFDIIHALSSFVFLFVLSKTMIEKIDRIKIKYGV